MSPTREDIISDLELRLTNGKPSDDLELERDQIGAIVDDMRDYLVVKDLNDTYSKEKYYNPAYIKRTSPLTVQSQLSVDQCSTEYYIEITEDTLDVGNYEGIVLITDPSFNEVHLIRLEEVFTLRNFSYAKPSPDNMVCYKEGKKLYILGINNPKKVGKLIAHIIPSVKGMTLNVNDPYPIDEELLPMLKDMVEETLRRQLGTTQDIDNDGQQ